MYGRMLRYAMLYELAYRRVCVRKGVGHVGLRIQNRRRAAMRSACAQHSLCSLLDDYDDGATTHARKGETERKEKEKRAAFFLSISLSCRFALFCFGGAEDRAILVDANSFQSKALCPLRVLYIYIYGMYL